MIRRNLVLAAFAALALAACGQPTEKAASGSVPKELTFSILSAENQASMEPLCSETLAIELIRCGFVNLSDIYTSAAENDRSRKAAITERAGLNSMSPRPLPASADHCAKVKRKTL